MSLVVSKDGTRIWADQAGDPSKPAIVFIAGLSCIAQAFDKQWQDLNLLANLHMVRYDSRGQGQSDQPLEADAYVSATFAEDFKAVCDAFDLKKPFVAGWSMGAAIPIDVVALYGIDHISGVIILAGAPYRSMHHQVMNPLLGDVLAPFMSTDLTLWYKGAQYFVDSCVAHPEKIPIMTKYAWISGATIQHPIIRTHLLARIQDERGLSQAKKSLPYLALLGAKDTHNDATKMAAFIRKEFEQSEVHVFDDCGHSPFYEKPEETREAIFAFVSRVARKA